MITPAKWQTAEADQKIASKMSYGEFRKKLVPYMEQVTFYPDSGECFEIYQLDGISWYLINKQKDKDKACIVINKCKCQKYFNSEVLRDITNRQTLNNIGNEINIIFKDIKKFSIEEKFKELNKKYVVAANTKLAKGNKGILTSDGRTYCISMMYILDREKNEKCPSEENKLVFTSNTKEECESFISYINTKLVRFLVLINISKLNGIWTDDYFRFVPAPPSGKFDHIYTDEELYDAFNLPQKYRDVIEAVIKERK